MLARLWYGNSLWRWGWPLALLFALISGVRRLGYRRGWLSAYRATLPVVVVGNSRWGQRQDPGGGLAGGTTPGPGWRPAWSAAAMAARRPITPIDWMSSTPAEAGMSPCSS